VDDVYEQNPSYFTLKIFHYGHFSATPGRRYDSGVCTLVDYLDVNEFRFSDMSLIMPYLGYENTNNMWFYYKIPGCDLDRGLYPLRNDEDVARLVSYNGTNDNRSLCLYVVRSELGVTIDDDLKRDRKSRSREDTSAKRRLFVEFQNRK
jgi:hypothetical protein